MSDELIERLRQFAAAYPQDIFTPLTEADYALSRGTGNGIIDRASAAMGRHFSAIFTQAADALEAAQALADRCKQESQIHAQEARTANTTIAEIYQCVSGATGEPGNWHGAEPVRQYVEAVQKERDFARDAEKAIQESRRALWHDYEAAQRRIAEQNERISGLEIAVEDLEAQLGEKA